MKNTYSEKVGSTYWLPRVKNSKMNDAGSGLGRYIALTGAKLKADDLMYAGIGKKGEIE